MHRISLTIPSIASTNPSNPARAPPQPREGQHQPLLDALRHARPRHHVAASHPQRAHARDQTRTSQARASLPSLLRSRSRSCSARASSSSSSALGRPPVTRALLQPLPREQLLHVAATTATPARHYPPAASTQLRPRSYPSPLSRTAPKLLFPTKYPPHRSCVVPSHSGNTNTFTKNHACTLSSDDVECDDLECAADGAVASCAVEVVALECADAPVPVPEPAPDPESPVVVLLLESVELVGVGVGRRYTARSSPWVQPQGAHTALSPMPAEPTRHPTHLVRKSSS